MKLLLDYIPLILFFAAYRLAGSRSAEAAELGTQWFGALVGGGTVSPEIAPVLWATVVAIAATALQVALLMAMREKVGAPLWISLLIIVVMGGLTLALNSETFIKLKPTLLYATFAVILTLMQWLAGKNALRSLMGASMKLPDAVWSRVLWSWVFFFVFAALLNAWVAYSFDTSTWVNFKVFGLIGLTLAFLIAQVAYLSRHLKDSAPEDVPHADPRA